MTEHWATLVSIIIGLGIADLLVNFHRLIHARRNVEWDALPLVWAVIALLWLFNYWWAVGAGLDGSRDARVVGHYVLLAVLPILLFLMSASVLPRAIPESGQLDMRAEWSRNRDVFLTILAINQTATWIVAIAVRGAIVLDFAAIVRTIALLCAVGALLFRARRFEWLAATVVLVVAVARISSQAIQ
jgi:predicted membrane channel-forming protein YqfA (hemolysin III family)